jgi:hypothetical protein
VQIPQATADPSDFENLLAVARELTFEDARRLSSFYEREPRSSTGLARKASYLAAEEHGLMSERTSWRNRAILAAGEARSSTAGRGPDETWRWAMAAVLDAVAAMLTKRQIETAEYDLLVRPWMMFQASARGAPLPRKKPTPITGQAKGRARGVRIPFLEERIGPDEEFIEAVVLERTSYSVAYLLVHQADGTYRVTHRGTGRNDSFDTLVAHDIWEARREVELLKRRFNLEGARLSADVRFFVEAVAGIAALKNLPDESD